MFQARGLDQVDQLPVREVNKDNDNDEDDDNQWLSMIINDNDNVDDDAGDEGLDDYDNDDSGGDGFLKMIMIMMQWVLFIW